VLRVKVYAFVLASVIAGVGGIALTFASGLGFFLTFSPLTSVLAVSFAVIGGVGYVLGPLVGLCL